MIKLKELMFNSSDIETYIRRKYEPYEFSVSERGDRIILHVIRLNKEDRGSGVGTKIMNDLTDYADKNGKRIELTPFPEFGATSISRLIKFYKRFDFVENKGEKKDFTTKNTMYRDPR